VKITEELELILRAKIRTELCNPGKEGTMTNIICPECMGEMLTRYNKCLLCKKCNMNYKHPSMRNAKFTLDRGPENATE